MKTGLGGIKMMNDKLVELAIQSGVVESHVDWDASGGDLLEKFAQSIIKECLTLSSDLNPFDAMDAAGVGAESQAGPAALFRVYDNAVDQYYDAIKNHFGVDDE